ncbi:hypothetical protein HDV05_007350 [Chytridiales sp. JEL 0842]|nr:hypothetical protein HDV05_007350 [Chytridiales sp. JEL 0842]
MSLRNRKSKDIVSEHSESITSQLNDKNSKGALSLIRYWGNVSVAESARLTGIDSAGFDIQYKIFGEPNTKQEMRIQFSKQVASVEAAKLKLKEMITESDRMLNVEIDKEYVPPGRESSPDWHLPKARFVAIGVVLWALCLAMYFVPDGVFDPRIDSLRLAIGGLPVFERILTAVTIMHGVEAAVSTLLCIYARVPIGSALLWPPTVFVFGVPSLQNCLKVCIKHAMVRDPETFGVPKGVLDGTYTREREAAKERAKSK